VIAVDLDSVRAMLRDELDKRSRIDADVHADHHRFVAELIERGRRRRDMLDKAKGQILGWAVIAGVGSFAAWVAKEVSRLTGRAP
jgi:hypothetical protein